MYLSIDNVQNQLTEYYGDFLNKKLQKFEEENAKQKLEIKEKDLLIEQMQTVVNQKNLEINN